MTATSPTIEVRAHRLDTRAVLALVLCCALWGLNQVAIKAVLPEVPALIQLAIRSVVALGLVLAWMRWRGIAWNWRDGTLAPGLLAGLLFAVEFGCIFVGLQYTTAARSVVFINTSPFVVALMLAWLVPAERLRPLQTFGLVLAFAGVAYAFAEPAPQAGTWPWLGDTLIIVAAVLWGLTTVVIRFSALRHAPAEKTLAYQLLVAGLLSPLAAWAAGSPWPSTWSPLAIGSVFYQAVIVTFASYLIWFWLLTRYPATRVQAFVFLTPVFGTVFAGWLLGEQLGGELLSALVAVAIGLSLLNRRSA
ncbi:DMT family transporter [uncultured Methylibium sp.]|uniref:DMT family transporter n=1 Tax=uncultured Methylibium sp. TaxID=381093 RepID=UPI0025F8F1E4|nr:DMT family transporter [uncultured Methylibium sp.]